MNPLVSREGVAGSREPAEHDAPARPGALLFQSLSQLPWLAPSAESLAALCRPTASADLWKSLRSDPGMVLLLLRQPEATAAGIYSLPYSLNQWVRARLEDPSPLEEALAILRKPSAGFVDWARPEIAAVYRSSIFLAERASHVAEKTGCCDPQDGWIAGLLAPLGWLAVSALFPEGVANCLGDPSFKSDPAGTQRRHWGLDQPALSRRLGKQWRLPDRITAVAGCLGLPFSAARSFGATAGLFQAVKTAIADARQYGFDLGLDGNVGTATTTQSPSIASAPPICANPYQQPWIVDLLTLAAENHRLRDPSGRERLEREIDELHQALQLQVSGEAERIRQAKLEALGEFAGGAGHEINNPLAVISGQAQYLLGHEAEWFHNDPDNKIPRCLHTIIAQTRRVHSLLRDVMLFARPAPSRLGRADLPTLLGEVAASLNELAEQKQVRLELAPGPDRVPVFVDAGQIKIALACLVRNALEAAPTGGWVRLVLMGLDDSDFVEVAVEDSGPGPQPEQVPSLFDPFFSGRSAGRGRGLGLPIAWRLARLHGGDVRLDQMPPSGATRFVLRLSRSVSADAIPVLPPEAFGLPAPAMVSQLNGQAAS